MINNTIFDVDAGINAPAGSTAFYLVNNIIGQVTQSLGNHIWIELDTAAIISTMHHNLLEGTVRITWGAGGARSLANFQGAFAGQGLDSLNANPLFRDAPNTDFRLQAASLAVDAGTADAVYSTFFTLYGINIAKDIAGTPRPQGATYDLGAYELNAETTPTPPATPTQLQVR
jgi:hypothetical protein